MTNKVFWATAALIASFPLSSQVNAATLYYTNFAGRQIYSLDTVTKATTLVDTVPVAAGGNPDSLVFDSSGRIIYTIYNGSPGQIRIFDPVANTDTLVATGFGSQLVDLTLEPSLNTVLVADRGAGTIDRVDLTTHAVTTLGAAGAFPGVNGLAYDASNNLYAVVNNNAVDKINPVTGAIITAGASAGSLDGLTYDSVSNKLWAASGGCIFSIDLVTLTPSACIATPGFAGNDGIVSDGAGHLYIAGSASALVAQYTIAGGALVAVSNNLGSLDDIAPAAGLGAPPATVDAFRISYAANLSAGDTVVDITNVGTLGAALQSGTTATITGAVCANVYAFTPDEQLVSCCSCPVTPNGLVSLSAKNDLASNTLTPAVPTALVIKIITTAPVAGSCTNSAAGVITETLAPGLRAFSSTLHATPTAGGFGITETPFLPATLSPGELNRLGSLCNFIVANGSGFGVCRSCRLGGLGSDRQ